MTVVWLTGLPAVGKSTVAEHLRVRLQQSGKWVLVLDSDDLRKWLTPSPTYDDAERDQFYRVVGRFAGLASSSGAIAVVAATAPKRVYRDAVRHDADRFVEVLLTANAELLEARDPKGLYAKVKSGEIKRLPGRGAPYEAPSHPELSFDTGKVEAAAIAQQIFDYLADDRKTLSDPAPEVQRPSTIMVGIDFSPLSAVACKAAFVLARRMKASRVHLVHVIDRATALGHGSAADLRAEEEAGRRAVERLETHDAPDLNITREVRRGIPSRYLALAAQSVNADVVVVASRGHGSIRRSFMGSVAASLIRSSQVPVLVVGQERQEMTFARVLAAVDGSPMSRRVVETAKVYAEGAKLMVVSALKTLEVVSADAFQYGSIIPDYYDALRAARRKDLEGVHDQVELIDGAPSSAILHKAESENADMIVIGTSGRSAWRRAFLGSTATRVLAQAACPVLVIPTGVQE